MCEFDPVGVIHLDMINDIQFDRLFIDLNLNLFYCTVMATILKT